MTGYYAHLERADARPPAPRPSVNAGMLVGAVVLSLVGGFAVGSGFGLAAIGLAALPLALFVLPRLSRAAGLAAGYFAIEVPLALLLLSTLVFRIRDAESLADNPLDSAALYRLACVGGAALLGCLTLLRTPIRAERVATPPAVLFYAGYVAVVFLGAPLSLNLQLTAYRGVELAVGLLVIVAAVSYAGREAVARLERGLFLFLVLLVLSVWIGVVVFPGQAIGWGNSPIPFQIQGVLPVVSSNGVGETGALLLLWSLAARVSGRSGGVWNVTVMALGAVTLVAGQYRTGYFALAVALMLLLVTRGRRLLALLAALAVVATLAWSASSITRAAEPYLLRGQTREQAAELSGRVRLWENSIPVWRESPLLGKGLLTATRFEVLARLGYGTVSTIHGTWVEALVGTGIAGVSLLVLFLVSLWRSALRDLLSRQGLVYPAMILAFISVRSITGPSFEVFGVSMLLLLVLAYRLALTGGRRGMRHVANA
ncbi:MAG TPA: O-antigen ligase family protein [Gaiellaceae bacterium]|nr:O-antigen ligase family protein [Gaiellaceae bacterium]